MKLLVLGCKLQGIEVIYLAKKAGYTVTAADHDPDACGAGMADRFVCCDVYDENVMSELFRENDIAVPVIEDEDVCRKICEYGKITGVPVIFDADAYHISSSKKSSKEMFEKLGLPVAKKYPECGFPVIVKPDGQSGSQGVVLAENEKQLSDIIKNCGSDILAEEYLEGRSFSLEVLRNGHSVIFPMITEVMMDDVYDCKRIKAPAVLSEDEKYQMYGIAELIDRRLDCDGIFDIEVISHNGRLKLLEIDARFPSQTPISVYNASGLNMIQWLVENKLYGKTDAKTSKNDVCWYQQIEVKDRHMRVYGEHIMSECHGLKYVRSFFGADEAITNFGDPSGEFCAIIIVNGKTHDEAERKFRNFLKNIVAHCKKEMRRS